jgi:hypothetical protein
MAPYSLPKRSGAVSVSGVSHGAIRDIRGNQQSTIVNPTIPLVIFRILSNFQCPTPNSQFPIKHNLINQQSSIFNSWGSVTEWSVASGESIIDNRQFPGIRGIQKILIFKPDMWLLIFLIFNLVS